MTEALIQTNVGECLWTADMSAFVGIDVPKERASQPWSNSESSTNLVGKP